MLIDIVMNDRVLEEEEGCVVSETAICFSFYLVFQLADLGIEEGYLTVYYF